MKKLLVCLTAGLLTTGATSSVAACSQKLISSLNDKTYLLQTTDENKEKYDVMRWSNDVLTAEVYKKESISLAKKHLISSDDPWTWLQVIKGHRGEKPTEGSSTLISQLITDYQKSSNTGEKTGDFIKPEFYDKELTYRIYDENNDGSLVTSFNDETKGKGEWTDELTRIELKEEGDVFVIHLKFAIETPVSEKFIGARQNITDENKEQLKDFYKNLDESKNKIPETSAYDYRYDVQFYFSFG